MTFYIFLLFIDIDVLPSTEVVFIYILTTNIWVGVFPNSSNKEILKILLLSCVQWSDPATFVVSSQTAHPWLSVLQPLGFLSSLQEILLPFARNALPISLHFA